MPITADGCCSFEFARGESAALRQKRQSLRSTPRALDGTFAPKTDAGLGNIVLTQSVDNGSRSWVIGVRNLGTTPEAFLAGAVCTRAKLRVIRRSTSPIAAPAGQSDGANGKRSKRARYPVAATFGAVDDSDAGQFTLAAAGEDDPGSLSLVVTSRGHTPERVTIDEVCVG
jgi:hypothetical protein